MPPVAPMLAKPVAGIPPGRLYEPKWDGFRSIVFRDGDEVEIGSRNERPMTRYFPDVVAAVREHLPERCVIDGEIVVPGEDGRTLDFWSPCSSASTRPTAGCGCSPGARRRASSPSTCSPSATTDLTERPFAERRAALERALAGAAAARAPDADHARRGRGGALVRRLRGRRPGRPDRQGPRRALPAGTSA